MTTWGGFFCNIEKERLGNCGTYACWWRFYESIVIWKSIKSYTKIHTPSKGLRRRRKRGNLSCTVVIKYPSTHKNCVHRTWEKRRQSANRLLEGAHTATQQAQDEKFHHLLFTYDRNLTVRIASNVHLVSLECDCYGLPEADGRLDSWNSFFVIQFEYDMCGQGAQHNVDVDGALMRKMIKCFT